MAAPAPADASPRNPCAPGLIALRESAGLGAAVARAARVPLIALEERRFEGGEFKLRPLESVRGRSVFVLEPLASTPEAPVCERLVRLLFLLQALRDGGAATAAAVLPYLAFARKDRRTQPRDPVNSRYIAQLLEASGATEVLALDVHNQAAFDNGFRIPAFHLTALPMMVDHFAHRLASAALTVVSPDVGGIKRAQLFREQLAARMGLDVELAFVEKRRARDVVTSGVLAGEVAGRTVVVLDDLCASGGTLIRAAQACRRAGAAAVHAAVTHAPLAPGLQALLAAEDLEQIVVTDSVGMELSAALTAPARSSKLVILPIAPLLGAAVERVVGGRPLSPLLERWPPASQ
jgi:ribose-phosphate pyrophosphokinase